MKVVSTALVLLLLSMVVPSVPPLFASAASTITVQPVSITTSSGPDGGQPVGNLAVRDQFGALANDVRGGGQNRRALASRNAGNNRDLHHGALTITSSAATLPPPVTCPSCWHPALNTSWQWQLSGTVDQTVTASMYDIDMFDNTASVVSSLHGRGRTVICYIDAGTWENWRPDATQFPASVKGKPVSGWAGERWLDVRQAAILQPLMAARLNQCAAKGFNGVEFDNVDGYTNSTGFPLSARDQLAYNVWLANQAHQRGLSVALKNDLDQVPALVPYFDWALDEQCFQFSECAKLHPFISAGKAVMEVEYNRQPSAFCGQANSLNFNALSKHLSLDAYRVACR